MGLAMSLRDQLLKAGLVSAEQAKKAERQTRKLNHQVKKDKVLAEQTRQEQQEQQRQLAEQAQQKRDRDRELNQRREQEQNRKALLARVRQMLTQHRQNHPDAELLFNFQFGKKIRRVRVTAEQQRQLAMGRLGVARNPHDAFDYPLVPRAVALKLAALGDEFMAVLHPETDRLDEDDDWPADW